MRNSAVDLTEDFQVTASPTGASCITGREQAASPAGSKHTTILTVGQDLPENHSI